MHEFPPLNDPALVATRDACHAYARVLGGWTSSARLRRKHWWHLSLRPSLRGVTTGVIHAGAIHFELELDLLADRLCVRIADGAELICELGGRSALDLAGEVRTFLVDAGVEARYVPDGLEPGEDAHGDPVDPGQTTADYSAEVVRNFAGAWQAIAAAFTDFRAGVAEETSPIMLWPGHFDLAMMWLPGRKIPGQDPADEEYSDKQMNFGFTLGDATIAEPYFYITAFPLPDSFPDVPLAADASWHSEGFSGVVLPYAALRPQADPHAALVGLWSQLLDAGRKAFLD